MVTGAKARHVRGAKEKCDVIFSLLVRGRGECESCHEREYRKLQCAHIVGRISSWTRTDFDNALCLCWKCHHHFTIEPYAWVRFLDSYKPGEYDRLKLQANEGVRVKFDWDVELMRLMRVAGRVFPEAPTSYTSLVAWLKERAKAGVS